MSDPAGGDSNNPTVKDRWWVDTGDKSKRAQKAAPPVPVEKEAAPVGSRLYRSAVGFDQETARARLTDLNMKLLVEANPPEGGWGYVQLAETPFSEREREKIQSRVNLPGYARGAVIDGGRSLRLLFTGTPIGERILDLALTEVPSFDCWILGDWVREEVFENQRHALGRIRRLIEEFLSPEGIAMWESLRAQA
jgi:hypothetical protein